MATTPPRPGTPKSPSHGRMDVVLKDLQVLAGRDHRAALPVFPGVASRTAADKALNGITDEGKGRHDIDWLPDATHGTTRNPAVHPDQPLLDAIWSAIVTHRNASRAT